MSIGSPSRKQRCCSKCGLTYVPALLVYPHACEREVERTPVPKTARPLPGQRALPGFGVEDVPLPSEGGGSE